MTSPTTLYVALGGTTVERDRYVLDLPQQLIHKHGVQATRHTRDSVLLGFKGDPQLIVKFLVGSQPLFGIRVSAIAGTFDAAQLIYHTLLRLKSGGVVMPMAKVIEWVVAEYVAFASRNRSAPPVGALEGADLAFSPLPPQEVEEPPQELVDYLRGAITYPRKLGSEGGES